MDRVTAEELRFAADNDWDVDDIESGIRSLLHRAADTLDDIDKDIAALESNKDHLEDILREHIGPDY